MGGFLGFPFLVSSPRLPVLLVPVVTAVLHVLPELLLPSRGQERQPAITLELADTLDQTTVAVEAGPGFEAAMARAGRNGTGPLAQEPVRTVQDIAVGRPLRDAYRALAERTQAGEMRLARRQRAEEKARQIPVEVIFPLMLVILPTSFIVLLGPAVLDVVANF